jgi:serpin B
MTLFVPDSGHYLKIEDDLTASFLSALTEKMVAQRVSLTMPKFDIESTINANAPLIAMGMGAAFDPDLANFSGMTGDDILYITDVLQKATIIVDEAGTEAAAATAVIMGLKSMPIGEPISLVIDRPFMFLIQHVPTDTILFMGRVMQP